MQLQLGAEGLSKGPKQWPQYFFHAHLPSSRSQLASACCYPFIRRGGQEIPALEDRQTHN